jgi:hypothetical protein
MKLTEKRLKEIILEEMNNMNQEKDQGQKIMSDVEMVNKQLSRIDNIQEYEQIMSILLKLDNNISASQKSVVLRKIRDEVNKMLQGKA